MSCSGCPCWPASSSWPAAVRAASFTKLGGSIGYAGQVAVPSTDYSAYDAQYIC
ncbi:MAG TPA: hypothetical protein VMI73_04250 [Trebonia sp.]|nr:hypothetical protein [Trebonia sp.]